MKRLITICAVVMVILVISGVANAVIVDFTATSSASDETLVCLWQSDKKGAVSMTFDDGLTNQKQNAFPILQEHGFKATFFIVTDSLNWSHEVYMNASDIQALSAAGQEIGSHTVTHPNLTTLSHDDRVAELSQSQSYLQALTGQNVDTLAYPYGNSNSDVINDTKDYYIAARGIASPYLNASSPVGNQWYNLSVIFPHPYSGASDDEAVANLNSRADQAASQQKWAIEIFHSITDDDTGYDPLSSGHLDEHLDYLTANEPNLWVGPMGTVAKYIYERNAAQIDTVVYTDYITVDVNCGLDSQFDVPLTLLTPCPTDWLTLPLTAHQGETILSAFHYNKSGVDYICYDAIPNAGTVTLGIPEPAAVCLLGLGALSLISRKRSV